MFRVLFVCTGNICRSPTAAGIFQMLVDNGGLSDQIETDSAGIGSWHSGEAPDPRSMETALRRGIDISAQQARTVRPDDFEQFNLVLAMDLSHFSALKDLCPKPLAARIRMFTDFTPRAAGQDVPDPYHGGDYGFERVFDMIETGAKGLLAEIELNHLK
ncbi:MAG: low molecular weight protein-tyrosine-phosphatase [Pseudomonadota bacterium]|nr:low molecular weight protein-tyrosine-phosphatase [Pseudomonadota bacterium]